MKKSRTTLHDVEKVQFEQYSTSFAKIFIANATCRFIDKRIGLHRF